MASSKNLRSLRSLRSLRNLRHLLQAPSRARVGITWRRHPAAPSVAPLLLALMLAVGGCNNNETSQPGAAEPVAPAPIEAPSSDLTLCSDPRPEFCTMDYNPVCGTLEDGSSKTYSNGCTACSDAAVAGWILGACE